MLDVEMRSVEVEYREDAGTGYLEGIAMPAGEVATIQRPDGTQFRERFEAGAIEPDGTVWLYDQHKTPIGVIETYEERAEGFWIRAKLALSDLAVAVRAQLQSGARRSLSVGFVAQDFRDEDGIRVVTRARLREVSVVDRPAYQLATVLSIREDSTPPNTDPSGGNDMTDTATPDPTVEFRGLIEELDRKVDLISARTPEAREDVVDTRSAAEVLKALVKGDEATATLVSDVQTRAYTGGTTADNGATLKPGYVGDLTRIIDSSSGVLASVFSTGVLPESGMSLEFSELNTDTTVVAEQVNEGDDLVYGKVTLKNRTAPIKTYGGYTQLSRQEIERSTLPILQRTLEAQSIAAGKHLKAAIRSAFNTVVADRTAVASNGGVVLLGSTLAAATYNGWVNVLVDGSTKFSQNALNMETLVVSPSVFKKLASLSGSDNRPMLSLDGTGANTVGRLNVTALNGSLAGVPVVMDADATSDSAVFTDSRAIRVYASAVAQLQDENIINLSKTFSVYRYAAFAPEIPAGIVPVKLAAS